MNTNRTCNLLAAALATALLSPLALAQSGNANDAAQQAQQVPSPPMSPEVTPQLPVATDQADPQRAEDPMTSDVLPPQSQAGTQAAPPSDVAQRTVWAELDADADGKISAAEANADAEFNTHFAMMDSDADGFVSDAEYGAHARSMQGSGRMADTPPPPPVQSQGAQNAASGSAVVQREQWAELDTDGDGRISSVEASLDPEFSSRFRTADVDSDGFVTDTEFRMSSENVQQSGDADIDEEGRMYDESIDTSEDVEPEPEPEPPVDERDAPR